MTRTPTLTIPPALRDNVLAHFKGGAAWLERLPDELAEAAAAWSLRLEPGCFELSFNCVVPARDLQGAPRVLKLGVPRDELRAEAAALRCFDGQRAVRLLAADEARGWLLLERLHPGESLLTLDDPAATERVADVMVGLWRPPPPAHAFPHVADWLRALEAPRHDRRIPAEAWALAGTWAQELLASTSAAVLLHGDLHHANVLRDGERWLAIDPKGVIGEPAYEVGAWLRNWMPDLLTRLDPITTTRRRVACFSARLGAPQERLLRWGFVQAILSAAWSQDDPGDSVREAVEIAAVLRGVLATLGEGG